MGTLLYIIWPGLFYQFGNENLSSGAAVAFSVILCFFLGMVIQELGSLADYYIFHVKKNAHYHFLNDKNLDYERSYMKLICKLSKKQRKIAKEKAGYANNEIVSNPIKLQAYQAYARKLLNDVGQVMEAGDEFSKISAQYVCSRMEYRLAYIGKDRKIEKMRAIFSMARSMIVCMFFAFLFTIWTMIAACPHLLGIPSLLLICAIPLLGILFYYRMKKSMKYMMLQMIGNFEADYYQTKQANGDVEQRKCKDKAPAHSR